MVDYGERHAAEDQLVGYNAEAPDVCFRVIFLSFEDFRADVERRAAESSAAVSAGVGRPSEVA